MIHGKAVSVGIIGGADGPTAIFVASPNYLGYIIGGAVIIAAIAAAIIVWKRKGK